MSYDGECATLKLLNLTPGDAARYTCVACNSAGEARSSTKITIRESVMERSGEAPQFKAHLNDKTVVDGDCVLFSVEITAGTDPVSILWLHDNCEITDSTGFKYGQNGNIHTLTILDAFPEDSGIFTCRATNKYGSVETGCMLNVTGKSQAEISPCFIKIPKLVRVNESETLNVTVVFSGYPEPVVNWSRDEDVLVSGDHYQIVGVGDRSTLSIPHVSKSDAGHYAITARNSAGVTSA
uniref:Ig-like domain-containing protein n=1 Tax=Romanomermis culicivorax TaxID=13658 RepID=A0A915JHJ8_ROMCU